MIQPNKIDKETKAAQAPKPLPPASAVEEQQTIAEAKIYRRGIVSVRDLIAPSALEIEPSFIRLNDQYVRTIFVTDYPRYISVGWFAPIINFNSTLAIALYTYPVRSDIILKQ